ncbi:MAG: ABC transporter substrate-binding protein [Rhodobacteraceae bacterium]|nr:ABC transporter substrate-binding protein [Paracoccaceae bacterium]
MKYPAMLLACTLLAAAASAAEPLKIAVLAVQRGPYAALGEEALRGFNVALSQFGGTAGGREILPVITGTDASPDDAVRAAARLVEQEQVEILIGPVSGSAGIALRDFAGKQPQVTIINGISAAPETTFVDPAVNFFRFNMDAAQWSAGLGDYIFNEKGYRKIALVSEDYPFAYAQTFGLIIEFCRAGGKITKRIWVPSGTSDFASVIAALGEDIDAVYLGLAGGDALNFVRQYLQAGGNAHLIGGTIMVDTTLLTAVGPAREALLGVPFAGPQADSWDDPGWRKFIKEYRDEFEPEQRFSSPSIPATGYFTATTAALTCVDKVGGDLSDGHAAFRACLAALELEAPNGMISLDGNRQAIGTNFVSEITEFEDRTLATRTVRVVSGINQSFGISPGVFAAIGPPGRDTPVCKADYE